MLLPVAIGDYTDFFASMHHAKNCGTLFRGPENPINLNWYAVNTITCEKTGYISFDSTCHPVSVGVGGIRTSIFSRSYTYMLVHGLLHSFQVPSSYCLPWASIINCRFWNRYH